MEIPEIKQRLTITEVLNHYNLKPTASGALQCPFHESKPGSRKKTLQVYTDTNRYQCFHKDCTAGNGDVIDFIEKMEQCSKHEAIQKAKQLLGVVTPMSKDTHDARSDVPRTSGKNPPESVVKPGSGGFFTDVEATSDWASERTAATGATPSKALAFSIAWWVLIFSIFSMKSITSPLPAVQSLWKHW